jgi:predicted DNA-binding transcriptional regulator YafY
VKRVERLYAIVDLLRGSSTPRSAARLARQFEVSTRTIERDIQSLQTSGVPIYADHGVSGGYSILREHSLPPLNFSTAESSALLAGLGMLTSSPYGAAARRARAKLLAVMSREDAGGVQQMLSVAGVIEAYPEPPARIAVDLLSDAVVSRRVVRLTYASADGEQATEREVETMGLLRGGDSWMLVGWCRLRSGIRGFHINRITDLAITDEVLTPRDPALLEADLSRWHVRRLSE